MAIALGALLAFFVVAVIAYPFVGSQRYRLVSQRSVNREKLRAERMRVYRKISDLEADNESGDLTESDFHAQRDLLRITAAKILREESGPDGPTMDSDEQLEQEISRMRDRSTRSSEGGGQSK